MLFFTWRGWRRRLSSLAGVLACALMLVPGGPAVAAASRGDDRAVMEFIRKMPAAASVEGRKRAFNFTVPTRASPAAVLDWAEQQYPTLFSRRAQSWDGIEYNKEIYVARAYTGSSATQLRYLGITPDGRIFGLGDFTNQVLLQFDTVEVYSPQVCAANPNACAKVNGKLTSQIRPTGYSSSYSTNADYRLVVDTVVSGIHDIVVDINRYIGWAEDIPLRFAGCGFVNAFFSTNPVPTSIWANLRSQNPVGTDLANVYGADDVSKSIVVMCHELTERAISVFFDYGRDLQLLDNYLHYFATGNPASETQELYLGAVFSSAIFGFQILAHEIGHGADFLLLNDLVVPYKKAPPSFAYPFANQCASVNCNTLREDFADWFSAFGLAEAIKGDLSSATPTEAKSYVGALMIATFAWEKVLGAGGGVVHGFTDGRMANVLCYVYGSSTELRAADAGTGGRMRQYLTAAPLNLSEQTCIDAFAKNAAATRRLIGASIRF